MRMMAKGKPFKDVPADDESAPTFSKEFLCENWDGEETLYDAVGKGDCRFILAVGEEYSHIIEALGPAATKAILDVKPRLVRRLGVSELILESLEDARDERDLMMEEENPSEITIDSEAAEPIWKELHNEYRRYYDPERAMDRGKLRMYHTLTDALGSHEQRQRKEEQDERPLKLARYEISKKFTPKKQKSRRRVRKAESALREAKNKTQREAASKEWIDATTADEELGNEEFRAMRKIREEFEKKQ